MDVRLSASAFIINCQSFKRTKWIKLIEILLLRSGIVTHQEITDWLYDDPDEDSPLNIKNMISIEIYRARKFLEPYGLKIKSTSNRGYSLVSKPRVLLVR